MADGTKTRTQRLIEKTKKPKEDDDSGEIDPEIRDTYNEFKQWTKQLKKINKKAKAIKDEENYTEVLDSLKEAKERLYDFMLDHDLKVIGDVKISAVEPTSVKNETKADKKKELLITALSETIPQVTEEQLEEIIEKLTI